MGCFSFLCKECGEPVNSDSFKGEKVILWHLRNGESQQEMRGAYDSYGRVFVDGTESDTGLRESVNWEAGWSNVCDDMFEHDLKFGIAAIHQACFKEEVPDHRSDGDPEQGWNDLDPKHT